MTKEQLLSMCLLEASIARGWAHQSRRLRDQQKRDNKELKKAEKAYFAKARYFISRAKEIKRDDFSNVPKSMLSK